MAELTTIARPYAEAAFALARDANALPAWSAMLKLGSQIVSDPRVADALDNPRLTAPAKESLLLAVAGDGLSEEGRNFVRVLVGADRIALMPVIATLFESLKDGADGVAKATIESAYPLDGDDLADLTIALARRFKRRIEPTVVVNEALVGGARITVGDEVIDGTVQEQLRAMAQQLRA
ncbi:MAG: F0F1 ATP synthase subunit delta [Burkholderiales bacterium]|nr:F0F1 ATP synthase subunit delta [Burkholderiales bacterium]